MTGCATFIHGTTVDLPILATAGDTVRVDGNVVGTTPLVATMSRKNAHIVEIGHDSTGSWIRVERGGSSIAWLNLISPAAVTGLAFDLATGGAYAPNPDRIDARQRAWTPRGDAPKKGEPQGDGSLAPFGTLIRVRDGAGVTTGVAVAEGGNSLLLYSLDAKPAARTVDLRTVRSMEYLGRRGNYLLGGGAGAVAGVAVGTALAPTYRVPMRSPYELGNREPAARYRARVQTFAIVGALEGALAGLAVAKSLERPSWIPVGAAGLSAAVDAAGPRGLGRGTPVELMVTDRGEPVRGGILAADLRTVRVKTTSGIVDVPVERIAALRLATVSSRRNAAIAPLAAAGFLGTLGAMMGTQPRRDSLAPPRARAATFAAIGISVGAIVGALIDRRAPRTEIVWRPFDATLLLGGRPSSGAVSPSWTFEGGVPRSLLERPGDEMRVGRDSFAEPGTHPLPP